MNIQGGKTVIGHDGILRSSSKVDFNGYPKFDCSFAKYLLDMGEKQLERCGDKIALRNADLGKAKMLSNIM